MSFLQESTSYCSCTSVFDTEVCELILVKDVRSIMSISSELHILQVNILSLSCSPGLFVKNVVV